MNNLDKDKLKIFLIGGNSVIGNAITNGIFMKYNDFDLDLISFIRSDYKEQVLGKSVMVKDYSEAVQYINQDIESKKIVIISFGVLEEESSSKSLIDNLNYHLEVNTFQTYRIVFSLLKLTNIKELHLVSSVLGDFIRPSVFSYSVSKNMLESLIENIKNLDSFRSKLFIWKPAFVESRLNSGRKPSFLKTNSEKITMIVSKKNKGGSYYIPRIAILFTNLAKFSAPLVRFLDKKL